MSNLREKVSSGKFFFINLNSTIQDALEQHKKNCSLNQGIVLPPIIGNTSKTIPEEEEIIEPPVREEKVQDIVETILQH